VRLSRVIGRKLPAAGRINSNDATECDVISGTIDAPIRLATWSRETTRKPEVAEK